MKNKFISLRTKIIFFLLLFSIVILMVVAVFVPSLVRDYLSEIRKDRMNEQKTVVCTVLDQLTQGQSLTNKEITDSLPGNAELLRFLDLSARSSEMSIWICIPKQTDSQYSFVLYQFGHAKTSTESLGGYQTAQLTDKEMAVIQSAASSKTNEFYENVFPSCFNGDTLSLSFVRTVQLPPDMDLENGVSLQNTSYVVFIHSAMDDLNSLANNLLWFMFLIIFILYIIIGGIVLFLTSHVIDPVKKIQVVADAIKNGDFSQTVEIHQNDEIGHLAQSFNEMTRELSEVDTIQSDFITNISHDFRSPLTSIKGYVEAILDGTIDYENQNKYLNVVLDETNRLTKMTNNVLDLSKIQSGQIEAHPSAFDINEMIVRLALGFEKRAQDRQIEMCFQFASEHLNCFADENLIERVVYNLLDNALKFTPQKGTITVETSVVAKNAFISVKDTGIGISEESLPHVFERFHKGDKSRGKDRQGAGLGLTIVKQILLSHHKDITVESQVGEGTTFSFTLPLN